MTTYTQAFDESEAIVVHPQGENGRANPIEEVRKPKKIIRKKKRRDFVYHLNTRNISFLQTSKDLADLGIKNNMFFLILYDPSLMNVDPHDPNLTHEQKFAVLNECMRNPWYYLRECCRIGDDGDSTGKPYILNRGNLASTFCFLNHIDHYLVLPRQKGKTQSTVAIINWTFLFGTSSTEMMFINKQQADANNNLRRLKAQRDLLPPYMRMKELVMPDGKIDKGKDNVQSLYNPVNENMIVTKPRATSTEAAEGIGRGATQTVQYYDETEFTPFIKTIVEAAGPAFNTASQNAKKNNAAYCRVMTSTPGDLDTQAAQDAMAIIDKAVKWTEKFYDWTIERIEDYINMGSENGIVYIEYDYKQLGEGEEWFRKACKSVLNNPTKIKREILLQRLHGSNLSPFELEDLQTIEEFKRPVKEEIFINEVFRIDVYKELSKYKTYILGMDCSTGIGIDSTAFTLIDPEDLKPVAEFNSPYIGTTDAARLLVKFVTKYVPRTIICIERNSVGTAIIDNLMETVIRPLVYFEEPGDIKVDEKYDQRGFLVQEAARRRSRGVYTGTHSRPLMMRILEELVIHAKESFVTENITGQLMTLIRKKNGRIDHMDGKHDDSLFSYLIGLYVYYHGKNLQKFGFTRGLPTENDRTGVSQESYDLDDEFIPDSVREFLGDQSFKSSTQDEYTEFIRQQNAKQRTYYDQIDKLVATNYVENVGIDDDMNINNNSFGGSLSLFDELNDL